MPQQYTRGPLETRLWRHVTKTDTCWLWNGATASKGYGYISVGSSNRAVYAHRVTFEIAYGPIPDGMMVCHTCDNPLCVRNDDEGWYEVSGILHPRRGHLWLGTSADNTADMVAKGRSGKGRPRIHPIVVPPGIAFGERHGLAKLTEQAVREIRAKYAEGTTTYARLSSEYGIDKATLSRIIHRKAWTHVE